jgi:hypothetical protein
MDVRNKEQVISRMKAAVASKQFGQEDTICSLVADVSISSLPGFTMITTYSVDAALDILTFVWTM